MCINYYIKYYQLTNYLANLDDFKNKEYIIDKQNLLSELIAIDF